MKRALIISYYFPPAGGPGVQRVARHAKFLREFGYEPVVVSATPEDYTRPSEFQMPVDESLLADIDGVEVHRVASRQPFRLLGWLKRRRLEALREFLFIPDTAVTWIGAVIKKARAVAHQQPVDVIYTSVKPHSAALTGWLLKRALGRPWVIDFRDPWTQYFLATFPTRLHYRIEQFLERFLLRRADHIITITPTARRNLLDWCEFLTEDRVSVIPNGYDEEEFEATPVMEASRNGVFSFVYSGVFCGAPDAAGKSSASLPERLWRALRRRLSYTPRRFDRIAHSPKFLLDALRELFAERPELRGRIRLVHIGPFDEANQRYVRQLGIEDAIESRGYVPHDEAVRVVKGADALFFCLADSPAGERNDCVPQKVYEYLGSRRSVLALAPEGDARDFLREAGTAVICEPRDVSAIKQAVLELYEGRARLEANEQFIRGFRRRELTARLARIFDRELES
ncbi:MAG: glycosyltransferase family 4 protein [Acidobacteria bacterium]|nr:glycosyltransferase family 4 protein [Acidobacteriota bacterium]